MTRKYSTIQQHEPLMPPKGWNEQEKRLLMQIEEIFDDLYRRFGRLRFEDFGETLQETIENAETGANNDTVHLNDDGITITDDNENPVVTIGQNGDITCNSLTCNRIVIGGKSLQELMDDFLNGRIIVSDTQPDAHEVIWIKPTTGSGTPGGDMVETAEFKATETDLSFNGETPNRTMTLVKAGVVNPSQCKYGMRFRVYNISGSGRLESYAVTVTGINSSNQQQTITIASSSQSRYVGPGDYVTIDTLDTPTADMDNVCYGNTLDINVSMTFSFSGTRVIREFTTVKATGIVEDQTGDAVKTCEVYYLS